MTNDQSLMTKLKEISMVVIADENNGIGKENKLLAHMPADLRHFKNLTVGFPVIMGRKTFDSVDNKPLPKRRNIIITTQKDLNFAGAEVVHSVPEALNLCRGEEKVAIVGGATIYEQSMHLADTIHLTRIHHTFEADTFFPEIDLSKWEEITNEYFAPDDKNPFPYSFITYKKKR